MKKLLLFLITLFVPFIIPSSVFATDWYYNANSQSITINSPDSCPAIYGPYGAYSINISTSNDASSYFRSAYVDNQDQLNTRGQYLAPFVLDIPNAQASTHYYLWIQCNGVNGPIWTEDIGDFITGTSSSNITPTPASESAPVTTASLSPSQNADGTYNDPVTVTLSATADSGYSVANTYYTVDGGAQQTYTTPFTISGNGRHVLTYWSVDNNGVQELVNTKTFNITEYYNITGTVYIDSNQNGVQDQGENGYGGATITLNTGQSTTTDNNGNYTFTHVEEGGYTAFLTIPPDKYHLTTSAPAQVTLSSDTTQNFGIVKNNPDWSYNASSGIITVNSADVCSNAGAYGPNSDYTMQISTSNNITNYFRQPYIDNADQLNTRGQYRPPLTLPVPNATSNTLYYIWLECPGTNFNLWTENLGSFTIGTSSSSSPTPVTAINAGGDSEGGFAADTNYANGSTYTTNASIDTSNVSNPAPEAVYQSVRYGNFSYTIPNLTANGTYTLQLHFSEPYFGTAQAGGGGVGSRVFNVSVNGTQALSDFDVYQAAGGANKAVMEQIPVTADSNGDITVTFSSVVDNAMVSGIAVYDGTLSSPSPTPTPTPVSSLAISAGGTGTGSYVADTDYAGGTTYNTNATIDTSTVSNPAPEAVYQSVRYGNTFSYTIPTHSPNTNYGVRLDFSEPYWNSAGSREFNVSINGTQVLNNFDVYQEAGGQNKAVAETFNTTSDSNGFIKIQFNTVTDNAMVSGIQIFQQ